MRKVALASVVLVLAFLAVTPLLKTANARRSMPKRTPGRLALSTTRQPEPLGISCLP